MLYVSLILIVLAVILFWQARRQRAATGLPEGEIIYSDTDNWTRNEKALFDPLLGLVGRPDYLVQTDGSIIPVEVKSSAAPPKPYDSHIYQLAAYCLLAERNALKRPPYGILQYKNRAFSIPYTPELEEKLLDVLEEMRRAEGRNSVNRSHASAARCARCGYRKVCDQKL